MTVSPPMGGPSRRRTSDEMPQSGVLPLTVDEVLTTTRSVRRRLDLTRPVERTVIEECVVIAQQAPSASNTQPFHFVVVSEASQRAALGHLFRLGLERYKTRPEGLYRRPYSDADDEGRCNRIIASLEHLGSHIDEVPLHVIPCIEGSLDGLPRDRVAAMMASVIPAAWSFMLAARVRGLGTCWTTLHLQFGEQAREVLGLPRDVTQVALIPTAYSSGVEFRPAHRRPVSEILHWDRW